ncbi:uncharacterized protein LOC132620056 [Lycium barbarum]|uniref:uncharacterized protein LOC132620056 n=1 Tax=Lycium barbarum TaxID=112863 RepID=UPI00293F5649|nr:uncharacterized protein LOC132620056 [Lycium barbarum]
MKTAGTNCNGKIWFFVNEDTDMKIISDTPQEITLNLFIHEENRFLVTTMVYAKCDDTERLQLWDSIYQLVGNIDAPWLVGGDFNVVLNGDEKIGGNLVIPQDYEDFAFCINSCETVDADFKGSPFTWWNGRAGDDCIFERLDRVFTNSHLQQWFSNIKVEHLARTGSDHAPLLITHSSLLLELRLQNFQTF